MKSLLELEKRWHADNNYVCVDQSSSFLDFAEGKRLKQADEKNVLPESIERQEAATFGLLSKTGECCVLFFSRNAFQKCCVFEETLC